MRGRPFWTLNDSLTVNNFYTNYLLTIKQTGLDRPIMDGLEPNTASNQTM